MNQLTMQLHLPQRTRSNSRLDRLDPVAMHERVARATSIAPTNPAARRSTTLRWLA